MTIAVGSSELSQITNEIFSAVLGLELEPTAHGEHHPSDARVFTGMVQLNGEWAGAVTVELSTGLARNATAIMFDMADDELSTDDVRDTVGELANMVGGNVKSMLAGASQLSLPAVTEGIDYQIRIPGSTERERVAFRHDGELLVVAMLEQERTPAE